MKRFLVVIFLLCSCAGNSQYREPYTESYYYNFSQHNGKTIKSMTYREVGHGSYNHIVRILFTDGSVVEIAAYKYRQHIY